MGLINHLPHRKENQSRHPLPKGRGLCFVAVCVSKETSYVCSTEGPKQPSCPKTTLYFQSAFANPRFYLWQFITLKCPPASVCFFSVWCCSFTRVAHGGSEQQPNSQPYTTKKSIAFLTYFVKKKHRRRAFLPNLKDGVSCPKIDELP